MKQRTPVLALPRIAAVFAVAAFAIASFTVTPAAASKRLGRDVLPRSEAIDLQLDPRQPIYSGRVSVMLDVPAPTDTFRMHAQDLTIQRFELRGRAGAVATDRVQRPDGVMLVRAKRTLAPGAYTLEIAFSGRFDERSLGLYRLAYKDEWYAVTQFESIEARRAFPCWDEPDFKIPWDITLRVPTGQMAFANTPATATTVESGWQVTRFERSPPMPAYLVAFGVGPYESVPITGMRVPGRIITPRGQSHLATESVKLAPKLFAALERAFGRPYPYAKLDLIAVPEFAYGAMENVGAIVFIDRALLVDPAAFTPKVQLDIAGTIAHEMAHMWFGDLVTMRWWDDLWLNESFASWMGDKVTNEVLPNAHLAVTSLEGTQEAMTLDSRPSTHAMRQPVGDNVDLDRLADALAYQKGQALLEMFEAWLGPERFRAGINEYLRLNAWQNAQGSDLWNALSTTSGEDVARPMSLFLDQPGVPLITVADAGPGKVRFAQRRFASRPDDPIGDERWRIPLVLRFSDGTRVRTQRVLLTSADSVIALEGGRSPMWIYPNADARGYYRWNVSEAMLARLAAAGPALTTRERVGLLGNLQSLLPAGLVSGETYVRMVEKLASDREPEVLNAAVDAVEKTLREPFGAGADRAAYSAWVRRAFGPAMTRLGLRPRSGEANLVTRTRPAVYELLGRDGEDPTVIRDAHEWIATYRKDAAALPPSMFTSILHIAARDGDVALWNLLRERLRTAQTPQVTRSLLESFGRFESPALRDSARAMVLEAPLRPHELGPIMIGMRERLEARPEVWDWTRDHFDRIASRLPTVRIPGLAQFARDCREDHLQAVRAFFAAPNHGGKAAQDEFEEVADACEECAALRARAHESVLRGFEAVARP